jgi:hypothetical protein
VQINVNDRVSVTGAVTQFGINNRRTHMGIVLPMEDIDKLIEALVQIRDEGKVVAKSKRPEITYSALDGYKAVYPKEEE